MRSTVAGLLLTAMLCISARASSVCVFEQAGFPAADTASIRTQALHDLFAGASFASVEELASALKSPTTSLLVLPYGSAFPEDQWPALKGYMDRGGNLIVLGGRPFTRPAYLQDGAWKLREYSLRFASLLGIDQYETTPGSHDLQFLPNSDLLPRLPAFAWQRGFSPVLHLSYTAINDRQGAAGNIDARLAALAWGTQENRKLSAPILQIDHLQTQFTGGRWILVDCELSDEFAASPAAAEIVKALVARALRGAEAFVVEAVLPLYRDGEEIKIAVSWTTPHALSGGSATLAMTAVDHSAPSVVRTVALDHALVVTFPPVAGKGLFRVEATLKDASGRTIAVGHTGFWKRDLYYLRSGKRLSVNHSYFESEGKPLPVVGTTYMASDVQRLYYEHPNVAVWDADLHQIAEAGINMLRTGWWSGWDKLCDADGTPSERTLRTLEAYLMTARRYQLPVQFNFFAFLPDVLGGVNAYLDPVAVQHQQRLYASVARRFADVPFLAWDLINEPSFGHHLWSARPNGDAVELAAWHAWLKSRYASPAAIAAAWDVAAPSSVDAIPIPDGANAVVLQTFDMAQFEQETFAHWAMQIRQAIRGVGSKQLITVGQDEDGNNSRLIPALFGEAVDFTANHSWRGDDYLLWNSLVARQPGKPMLIQEMGVWRNIFPNGVERRSIEDQSGLFERKFVLSFAQGAGGVEWLWNTNAYQLDRAEPAIGALRPDQTEKPEAEIIRQLAAFARPAAPFFVDPQQPDVAIVTSQAEQFSGYQQSQTHAQQRAVQALCYGAQVPGYLIAENQISQLGNPRLVILPSAQALGEPAWQALLAYVQRGGNLLITGSIGRDDHWQPVDRLAALDLDAFVAPLTYRTAAIVRNEARISLSFDQGMQNTMETVRFRDGETVEKKTLGKGTIFWAAYPAEMAEEPDAATALYRSVLHDVRLDPAFSSTKPVSPGVLIYPTILKDALLYLFASSDALNSDIDIRDTQTGASIRFNLRSNRAAMVMLDKKTGSILAKYGF